MAVDGNFAGGFSQGINPFIASIRQDRRQKAQNDFKQKLINDQETANKEVRKAEREDRLAQRNQQQDQFNIKLLVDQRDRIARRQSNNLSSLNRAIEHKKRMDASFQKQLANIDEKFKNFPKNHPLKTQALNNAKAQYEDNIVPILEVIKKGTDEDSIFNEEVRKLDSVLINKAGGINLDDLLGVGGEGGGGDVVEEAPKVNPFKKALEGGVTVDKVRKGLKNMLKNKDLNTVATLGDVLSPQEANTATNIQQQKINSLVDPKGFDKEKAFNLERLLIRANSIGKDKLLSLAQSNKTTGESIFADSFAKVLGDPRTDEEVEKYLKEKKEKALTRMNAILNTSSIGGLRVPRWLIKKFNADKSSMTIDEKAKIIQKALRLNIPKGKIDSGSKATKLKIAMGRVSNIQKVLDEYNEYKRAQRIKKKLSSLKEALLGDN